MRCFARMQRGGSGEGSIDGGFAFRNQRETSSDFCGDVLVSAPAVPTLHSRVALTLLEIFQISHIQQLTEFCRRQNVTKSARLLPANPD